MLCFACGTENNDRSAFCRNCGVRLAEQPTPAAADVGPAAPPQEGSKCPACGTGYPASVRFCARDGTPLVPLLAERAPPAEQQAAATVAAQQCDSCGTPLKPNAKFCPECGTAALATGKPDAGRTPAAPQGNDADAPDHDWDEDFDTEFDEERPATRRLALIALGALLVLAMIGGGIWLASSRSAPAGDYVDSGDDDTDLAVDYRDDSAADETARLAAEEAAQAAAENTPEEEFYYDDIEDPSEDPGYEFNSDFRSGSSVVSSADEIERGPSEPSIRPTFSCDGQLSYVERMVCDDASLAQMERRTVALYEARRAASPGSEGERVLSDQRRFLRDLSNCGSRSCIVSAYQRRIGELSQ